VDVVVANMDDFPTVLRNDGGNANSWLLVSLNGTRSNRFGLGARVKISAVGLSQVAEATTASSVFSANDPRLHFGLGNAREVDIEVAWPGEKAQTFKAVPANQIVAIDQDKGILPAR
jgi:hypothetical protein